MVRNENALGRNELRRYYPQVELWRRAMGRTLSPRIYWENAGAISLSPTKNTIRLPTSSSAKKIHTNDTSTVIPQRIPPSRQTGNKENETSLQVYYVVHAGMRHNNNQGAERNRQRAIKSHWNNKNVVKLVAWLYSDPSKRESTVLAKQHEIANPLRRIVFSWMRCKKQLRRVSLPQVESEWRQAPKNQRSHRRQRIPSPPRCDISRRVRTWGNVL